MLGNYAALFTQLVWFLDWGSKLSIFCVCDQIRPWLQEHREMINSSTGWMAEAQSWLAAPCTYSTAKCLSSHVHALQVGTLICGLSLLHSLYVTLCCNVWFGSKSVMDLVCLVLQMVLDDSVQIRKTLQGFGSVLKEMSSVCDITTLQEELIEADRQVANVQDSFTAPLSQLEHAAAVSLRSLNSSTDVMCCMSVSISLFECLGFGSIDWSLTVQEVEAIESEVRRMENDVAEIKTLLSSPEAFPSPREESLKVRRGEWRKEACFHQCFSVDINILGSRSAPLRSQNLCFKGVLDKLAVLQFSSSVHATIKNKLVLQCLWKNVSLTLMPLLCVQVVEQRIQSMRRTIAEIQKCKPDLCLPDKSEETLTVFTVVDQLQTLLLELEKVSQSVNQSGTYTRSDLHWTCCFTLSVEGPCSVHPAASDSNPSQSSVSAADDVSASTPDIHFSGGWGEFASRLYLYINWTF